KYASKRHVQAGVPLIHSHFDRSLVEIDRSRIVEQHMQCSEVLHSLIDNASCVRHLPDVRRNWNSQAAAPFDLTDHVIQRLLPAAGDRDLCAFLGESKRRGLANACPTARDYCDFALQFPHAAKLLSEN